MASVIFVIFLTSLLIDKWKRWMMDLSKRQTIIVSLITVFWISFIGAWIWNDRFLDSGALTNFLSSRPNLSIAIELVVLISKGSLSTKLNSISCVRVMRLTGWRGEKVWKELWCGCHQPTTCAAVHFVVGMASPTCYLGIYPAFGRLPIHWTMLYIPLMESPIVLQPFLYLFVFCASLFCLYVGCCSLWPRFPGCGRMYYWL